MPHRRLAWPTLGLVLALAGCSAIGLGGEDDPGSVTTAEQRRARCDQMALSAAEAESLRDARSLATQAAQCYTTEIERGS